MINIFILMYNLASQYLSFFRFYISLFNVLFLLSNFGFLKMQKEKDTRLSYKLSRVLIIDIDTFKINKIMLD